MHEVHCGYFPFAKYDALSYTWGCSERNKILQTPEGILPITTSLFNALSRVRSPAHDICIWADGICINQDDPAEKEHQVKYMGEIYRWAETVLIYLGEAENESDLAFELLHNFVLNYGAVSESSLDTVTEPQARATIAHLCSKDWEPVRAIFRRPWFRRAWVVQEFLLAKNAMFICGEWKGYWTNLWIPTWLGVRIFPRDGAQPAVKSTELFPNWRLDDQSSLEDFRLFRKGYILFGLLGEAKLIRDEMEGAIRGSPTTDNFTADEEKASEVNEITKIAELYKLLWMFWGRETTEPRDAIFAYLGLLQEFWEDEPFKVDYSTTLADCLKDYGHKFLDKLGAMMLYSAGTEGHSSESTSTEWPSWIPQWSRAGPECRTLGYSMAAQISHFDASGKRNFYARLTEPDRNLQVHGVMVDTVRLVGKFNPDVLCKDAKDAAACFIIDCIALLSVAGVPA